jgi:hypothetical protein
MKTFFAAFAATLCITVASPAFAQDSGGFSLGVTGGTLGIGPEVGYRVSSTIGVRANATFFDFSHDAESDGVEYEGDLDLQSYGAMVDVYPFGSGFRLSGGARISNNKVTLLATPAATDVIEIGDDEYTGAQIGNLTGRVDAKEFAPTLTLGWGGGLTPGLKLGLDAGVMFQGSPRVTELNASGPAGNSAAVQASLAEERAEIEDDIDNFKFYPVLQLSVGYRF